MVKGVKFRVDFCPLETLTGATEPMYRSGEAELPRALVAGELHEGRLPMGLRLVDPEEARWVAIYWPEREEQVLVEVEETDLGTWAPRNPGRLMHANTSGLSLRIKTYQFEEEEV